MRDYGSISLMPNLDDPAIFAYKDSIPARERLVKCFTENIFNGSRERMFP